ncbi:MULTISPECIES: ExeA family protein [Janthinobacterium]|uniref:AAA family ATPase n=1 Tax=Janthinobacterium kumbetense TaxID=2950280 RepID=A0ABT0WJQ1_9BURK|nr:MULTISPECIES: AAA family ATPase [Janthinobacterium]MCM2564293.1 AAA family ATPase [Janthinobacterium kumbetense]MDN2675737.1 AAA family ATPase [Janthinobacterium sp. SUN033]MED5613263.1 AAA family ATPase [Janthinobacterium sp. P210005]
MNADTHAPPSTPPGRPYAPSPHGMYLRHFGLRTAPFGITPDPAFFYTGNTRGELLAALLYAVTQGEGIIKLTGEVGSGKTMLCRMLADRLPPQVDVLYLLNPRLEPDDVLHAIAAELGLELDGCRADAVLRALHGELIARHAAGRQVVLLAEEAQAMPGATLEALRLLTNLETASHKLLQIVLFGQPELQNTLDLPQFRQLKERITHSFSVPRLPPALLDDYLACRLAAAGRTAPLVFTPAAQRRLARAAQGIVRRINILADKALLAAFADDAQEISARHVRLAIADSPFYRPPWHAGKLLAGALSALMLLLAFALLWQWQAGSEDRTAATASMATPASQASHASQARSAAPADAAPGTLKEALVRAPQPAPSTLLDSKLAESRDWLARQGPKQLVLHIASLPATETVAAETFLRQAQQATGLHDLHVFRLPGTMPATASAPANTPPATSTARLLIVYGSFADQASAEAVWARLAPASPQKILLSDIDSIRTEIKALAPEKPGRGAP